MALLISAVNPYRGFRTICMSSNKHTSHGIKAAMLNSLLEAKASNINVGKQNQVTTSTTTPYRLSTIWHAFSNVILTTEGKTALGQKAGLLYQWLTFPDTFIFWFRDTEHRSSCMRSSNHSRNSRASCCEFPRNWAPYLETTFCS